ncbi:hypothetical protein CTheo_8564 [Ceratobasidium theobromae]|uniref:Fungal-type protein kinase domain-containing protein n=1 Tax=Ceratobasidium theobromae TaxID=1582974 RepID=A0A5N5Q994_9AGAM|nr:hypothetical protein CTheo_8564 [Ceratobasidium theobromae]
MLHGEMEATLCEEINGAVFEYSPFCKEFFEFEDQDRGATIMKSLAQEPLFNHQRQPWTIDCTGLKGNKDNQACETMATILDIISKAAFMKDQFRPVRSAIRPFHKKMDADDLDDTNTQPDIIQAPIYLEDRSHWAEVEFFAECKADPDKQGETNLEKLKYALLQLARYARATLVHQIYRLHVFAIAVCGTKATFVRLGRSGILHSPLIDLSTDFETFALAAAGLFALGPEKFGYNTDFYFWPQLTGEPNERRMDPNEDGKELNEDGKLKELRVKAGNRIWRVAEVLCQRKCLVGRATLVLLLSRVKNRKQRVVMKLIWRDKLRKDEGDNLKHFEDYFGICKCLWRKVRDRVSTSVKEESQAKPSFTASYFFPPLSEAEFRSSRSNSTNVSMGVKARSDPAKRAVMEKERKRDFPPQDRDLSVLLMGEGVGLLVSHAHDAGVQF